MRHLIDAYIGAEESEKISVFDDFSLVELIVERGKDALDKLPKSIRKNKGAMAETIENNLRKVIIEESPTNSIYYEKMSVLLDELIKFRNKGAIKYKEYLKRIVELTKKAVKPNKTTGYPASLNSQAKRALYDNLEKNGILALELDEKIKTTKDDDWRGTHIKRKKVKIVVKQVLKKYDIEEEGAADTNFGLVEEQKVDY